MNEPTFDAEDWHQLAVMATSFANSARTVGATAAEHYRRDLAFRCNEMSRIRKEAQ